MYRIIFLCIAGVLTTLLWDSASLKYPKLLVVLVHEIWHGLIALMGGALLEQIHIDMAEGGETLIAQIHSSALVILTVSAGYLGAAFTGALLLRIAFLGDWERCTLFIFAGLLAYISYLFTESGSLAFFVGLGWAGALCLFALSGTLAARLMLLFLGVFFTWYSLYDLLDFTRGEQQSDASILADYLREEGWSFFQSIEKNRLTNAIALSWSAIVLAMSGFFLYPVLGIGNIRKNASYTEGKAKGLLPQSKAVLPFPQEKDKIGYSSERLH